MDQDKRRALQRCTVELTRDMNPKAMRTVLFAKQMLTPDEYERLCLPNMTSRDQNMFILQKVPTKGSQAFDLFIDCLQDTAEENPAHLELVRQLMEELQNIQHQTP